MFFKIINVQTKHDREEIKMIENELKGCRATFVFSLYAHQQSVLHYQMPLWVAWPSRIESKPSTKFYVVDCWNFTSYEGVEEAAPWAWISTTLSSVCNQKIEVHSQGLEGQKNPKKEKQNFMRLFVSNDEIDLLTGEITGLNRVESLLSLSEEWM